METVDERFIYLNMLRESGVTNMFGAAPHLQEAFDMGRLEARQTLLAWMSWVNSDPKNVERR